MIDISDGLSTDLNHILHESRVSARLYEDRIPAFEGASDIHVLHGGEEYELLIVAPDLPSELEGVPLTRIGEITQTVSDHLICLVSGTSETILTPRGWQHFGA
jgi:thiamine-monophosphate kinase